MKPLWIAAVAAAVAATYAPVYRASPFVIDDLELVTAPQCVSDLSWRAVATFFTPGVHMDYYPLRDLSYWIDFQLFGASPAGYRAHQLLLFLELLALLALLLARLGARPAVAVAAAALWAAHPVHAELVGWLAARKDLLALVYGGYAALAWVEAERRRSHPLYAASCLALLASGMSKASLLLLPLGLGFLALLRHPVAPRSARGRGWLGVAVGLAIAWGAVQGWHNSEVSDNRFEYDLSYRLGASAAAFAKMLGGWLLPSWNIVDVYNSGDWLHAVSGLVAPGAILQAAFAAAWGLSVARWFRSRRRKSGFALGALTLAWAAYLPVSGWLFPHKNFYSARYLEPLLLVAVAGAALSVRRVLGGWVVASAAVPLFSVLLWATSQEASVWGSPRGVIAKARAARPEAVSLASLEYALAVTGLLGEGGEAWREEVARQDAWLLDRCAAGGAAARDCELFWSARYKRLSARGDWNAAREALERGSSPKPGDPPTRRRLYESTALLHQLEAGTLDRGRLLAWREMRVWRIYAPMRYLSWASACLLAGRDAAAAEERGFVDARLLTRAYLSEYVERFTHAGYREDLRRCLAP